MVFQTEETNTGGQRYHARSFEDAFFHVNKSLLTDASVPFDSLTQKYVRKFINNEIDVYDFCELGIGSKPSLAIEILLNSKTDKTTGEPFVNWRIPAYIKEGLIWLKKD